MKFFEFFIVFLTVNTFLDVQGVIWPCQSDADCSSVPTATCSQYGSCRCPAGYVFSTNFTKCLKASLYGDKCEESVQCSHMPSGASCKKGVCECDEGSTYIRGRCKILNGLNEPCKEDVDCLFGYDRESVKCTNNKCACADNYYYRYGNICRRKSVGIGDSCNVNQDCEYFDKTSSSAKCNENVCEASETRKTSREIAVQTSFDTFGHLKDKKGILKQSESVQDETVELKVLSEDTESSSKAFGDECTNNGKPCEGLDHSQCVNHICYCKLGYYNLDGKCMAEFGERGRNLAECGIDPFADFNPVTKTCICKHPYFYEPNLRTCRKPLRSYTANCVAQSQCSPFGLAYCDMDAKPKRCKCEVYAEYNDSRQLCIYKKGVGSYCEKAEDCKIPNTLCSNEKVCACKPQYVETKGQCLPGVGGNCTSDAECVVENSVCPFQDIPESKFCQCKKGYVLFDEKCIKEATEVGDDCVDNEQCKPLLGNLGKCIENKCGCDSKHHLSYGKCQEKIELGGKCTKTSECYNPEEPKAMECRNSACRCQPGYSTDVEKRICIKPKTNSSGRPSVLKIITFLLIGAAFLITSAALKQAYY